MEDDETDRLNNLCTDLVTLRRLEPALAHLFHEKSAGEWVTVAELYRAAGAADGAIKPELAAAWLPPPSGDPTAAVLTFCDEELQWGMTAYYNIGRLFPDEAARVRPTAVTTSVQ